MCRETTCASGSPKSCLECVSVVVAIGSAPQWDCVIQVVPRVIRKRGANSVSRVRAPQRSDRNSGGRSNPHSCPPTHNCLRGAYATPLDVRERCPGIAFDRSAKNRDVESGTTRARCSGSTYMTFVSKTLPRFRMSNNNDAFLADLR